MNSADRRHPSRDQNYLGIRKPATEMSIMIASHYHDVILARISILTFAKARQPDFVFRSQMSRLDILCIVMFLPFHPSLTEDWLYSMYFGKVSTLRPWSISYPGGIALQHAAAYLALPSHKNASSLQALYSTGSLSSSGFLGNRFIRRPHFPPISLASSE